MSMPMKLLFLNMILVLLKNSLLQFTITIHVHLWCNFFFFFRNDILTEELECQLTASVTAKKEDDSDSDLDIDWQIYV